jgi:hypothetical protein
MDAKQLVNIDFDKLHRTFSEYVREKAKLAGSTIVYVSNGQLLEEDPTNNRIVVLKDGIHTR